MALPLIAQADYSEQTILSPSLPWGSLCHPTLYYIINFKSNTAGGAWLSSIGSSQFAEDLWKLYFKESHLPTELIFFSVRIPSF